MCPELHKQLIPVPIGVTAIFDSADYLITAAFRLENQVAICLAVPTIYLLAVFGIAAIGFLHLSGRVHIALRHANIGNAADFQAERRIGALGILPRPYIPSFLIFAVLSSDGMTLI